MAALLNLLLMVAAFVMMEGVAYLTHRYIMHGPLWCLHKSHHVPRTGTFEKNDLFATFFAMPSIVLIYLGVNDYPSLLWAGVGMSGYGLAYFIFHDVIVHRRIRLHYRARNPYMKRIIRAHWMHHAMQEKEGAVSFGFLYAPPLERLEALRHGRVAG